MAPLQIELPYLMLWLLSLIEQRIIAKWGHVGLDWAVGSHACFLEPSLQANPGVVSLCFSLSLCKSDANHALGSRQDMAGKQAAE